MTRASLLAAALFGTMLMSCQTDRVVHRLEAVPAELVFTDPVPRPRIVTVRNVGFAAATIEDVSVGGSFPYSFTVDVSQCIGKTLPPDGGTCELSIVPRQDVMNSNHTAEVNLIVGGKVVLTIPVSYPLPI
jgi:hypothetical protein